MNKDSQDRVILESRSLLWPIIIFPYFERSHTAAVIGWRDRRPRVLKDVKASFAGRIWLTRKHLHARSNLLGDLLLVKIPLDSILSVHVSDQDHALIQIRYRQADFSKLLQFFVKGAPEGKIFLNLDGQTDIWVRALGEFLTFQ